MAELLGCWREAQRADKVCDRLLLIQDIVGHDFDGQITAIRRGIGECRTLLRDLFDLFPIYQDRVSRISYYLTVVLPSFRKTLQDMTEYLEIANLPSAAKFTWMVNQLEAQGDTTLVNRFLMSVELLIQMVRLLSKYVVFTHR